MRPHSSYAIAGAILLFGLISNVFANAASNLVYAFNRHDPLPSVGIGAQSVEQSG